MPGDWYVAHRYDGSCSLQIFVWPPGSRTKIHDHPFWGAFCCVVGALFEERYERLDDTSRPEFARLSKLWEWGREVGAAVVMPYEGAIHQVGNPPCTFAAPGLETQMAGITIPLTIASAYARATDSLRPRRTHETETTC